MTRTMFTFPKRKYETLLVKKKLRSWRRASLRKQCNHPFTPGTRMRVETVLFEQGAPTFRIEAGTALFEGGSGSSDPFAYLEKESWDSAWQPTHFSAGFVKCNTCCGCHVRDGICLPTHSCLSLC
eukprot:scaffold152989_cov16-Tisochrysis_lutea.AAC.2